MSAYYKSCKEFKSALKEGGMTSIKKGRMKDEHIWKDALDTLILSGTLSHWAKAELKAGMKLS